MNSRFDDILRSCLFVSLIWSSSEFSLFHSVTSIPIPPYSARVQSICFHIPSLQELTSSWRSILLKMIMKPLWSHHSSVG